MDEMEKIEKVQKLCEKTGAAAQDARNALEECQWDMFEAFLKLDSGKQSSQSADYGTQGQNGNGSQTYAEYNTNDQSGQQAYQNQYQSETSSNFGETVGKCVKWFGDLIKKGMDNFLDIERDDKAPIHIPITIFVVVLLFFHVFVACLLIIGLFCGFRYSFSGPVFNKGADYGDKDSNC